MSVAAFTQSLALWEVRGALAAALAPRTDQDPDVHPDLVDAVSPPCLMLEWADPWLTPRAIGQRFGPGWWDAHANILCMAGRVEPGPGVEDLERLIAYTVGRLVEDARSWPVETSTAPRRFDIGGVSYLGARLNLSVPVTIDTEEVTP